MNDLYIHQLETENKQLRTALQECRKALEEEITTKKKAIKLLEDDYFEDGSGNNIDEVLEILGDKE